MNCKNTILSILAIGFTLLLSCATIRQGIAILRTPNNFINLNNNVQIENTNEGQFGTEIGNILPNLIDSVENKHLHKFINQPNIYVCNTIQSFRKYTGLKGPRACATPKGIFISPRLKGAIDCDAIIYHELSHVILLQYVGIYRFRTFPVWFNEGLATYISNGGGSGNVTDSAAILEILQGNHFYPVANENVIFPKSFSNSNLPAWMQYRQSMLFVKFLKEGRVQNFNNLLNSLFRKKSFSKSIESSYGVKVSVLWNEFLNKLRISKLGI
jgi:hypothetical protein